MARCCSCLDACYPDAYASNALATPLTTCLPALPTPAGGGHALPEALQQAGGGAEEQQRGGVLPPEFAANKACAMLPCCCWLPLL
jgi:hypothetical protein